MSVSSMEDVLQQRLHTQHLVGSGLPSATDVVRLLTCVQSQEYAHAFWSLGMRTAGHRYAEVQQEFDEGLFLRTHILRPTWHFVAAEDLRWVLALTSPRVQQINRSRYRQLELDQRELDRGSDVLVTAVAHGNHLTRPELGAALQEAGIATDGQRLAYLVMNAELEALICSGPMRGAQHTYALVDERVATTPALTEPEALAELVRRFFVGHGPASLKDFTRWSSLTMAQATTGLGGAADRLARVEVAGQELWCDSPRDLRPHDAGEERHGEARRDGSALSWSKGIDGLSSPRGALLLPLYDEATLSYPQLNFPLADRHPHPPDADLFVGSVVLDRVNVGTWRRTVRGRKVVVETALAPGVSDEGRAAVARAVHELATFLGRELEPPGG